MSWLDEIVGDMALDVLAELFPDFADWVCRASEHHLRLRGTLTPSDLRDALGAASADSIAGASDWEDLDYDTKAQAYINLGHLMLEKLEQGAVKPSGPPSRRDVCAARILLLYGQFYQASALAAQGVHGGWQQLAYVSAKLSATVEEGGLGDNAARWQQSLEDSGLGPKNRRETWMKFARPMLIGWRTANPAISDQEMAHRLLAIEADARRVCTSSEHSRHSGRLFSGEWASSGVDI